MLDPLDQLSEWAVEKFSEIRNLGITPPAYPNSPWTPKELLVDELKRKKIAATFFLESLSMIANAVMLH